MKLITIEQISPVCAFIKIESDTETRWKYVTRVNKTVKQDNEGSVIYVDFSNRKRVA